MVYVEDPWSRIVNVHWKKDEEPPPPPEPGSAYCGYYGYGSILGGAGPGLIAPLPHGGRLYPPMVGTFLPDGNVGPDGTLYGGVAHPLDPPAETLTAPSYGQVARFLNLLGTSITFRAVVVPTSTYPDGIVWRVPMAQGQNADGIPMVVESFNISLQWATIGSPADLVGIGLSRVLPDGTLNKPETAFASQPASGGSIFYNYDFNYAEWARGSLVVTSGNQFDPALGGPAVLWSMRRRAGWALGRWEADPAFSAPLIGEGDYYTWEIAAVCQAQPAFVP